MSPFGSRGAADDFARLVDTGGTAAVPSPALALAARLRSAGASLDAAVAPRPEFRDGLRMRLMAVAAVQSAAPAAARVPAPVRALEAAAVSWRRRMSTAAAGAMASVVAVSGVAVAGSQSLPGDPFYGVKRTTEAFQLRTADGSLEKGTRHLDFAATRLREVRGLTLGRDAVDAGPVLGPAASAGGFTLRSAEQPLARGEALSAPVADRVRETLAEMDEQTKAGSALLTRAYRSSRAPEPLRVLSRFTTRQSAGLEQLIPALPPRTQDRARISLALLTGVAESTDELLSIGTCVGACDPSDAAPTAPSVPGTSGATQPPCNCDAPDPAPAPAPAPTEEPSGTPEPAPSPQPERTSDPAPRPSSPAPSPSPTGAGLPVPVPSAPVPLPPLPVPVPTLTLAPLAPAAESLPGVDLDASARTSTPVAPAAPAAAPAPLPQLAPLPPRP